MQAEAVKGDLVRRCHVATGPLLPFGSSVFKQLGHPSVCSSCLQEQSAPERIFQKLHTLKIIIIKKTHQHPPTPPKKNPQSPKPNKPPHPTRQIKRPPRCKKTKPEPPRSRRHQMQKYLQAHGTAQGNNHHSTDRAWPASSSQLPSATRLPARARGRKINVYRNK